MWKIDNGSTNGTTTPVYATALDWEVRELAQKSILLKNTHVSASLYYRLTGYVRSDGIAKELAAETLLAPGETAEFHYERQWQRFMLQVKSSTDPATYQADWQGQGA
jgi:hypothetical protein